MNEPILLRHSKADIGIRVVGVSLFFIVAGLFGYMITWPHVMVAPIAAVIGACLLGGIWTGVRMRGYLAECIRIGDNGIIFGEGEVPVDWGRIAAVRSEPTKNRLAVLDAQGMTLGTIPYGYDRFAEGCILIFRRLGERAEAGGGATGPAVVEGARSVRDLVVVGAMVALLSFSHLGGGRRRSMTEWLVWLGVGTVMVGYAVYRRSGTRRLTIDAHQVKWESRGGERSHLWSEIALIGFEMTAPNYIRGPSLLFVARDGTWARFALDDLDLGQVAALIRVNAPKLWESGFLHGRQFLQRAKEVAAANGVRLKLTGGGQG